MFFKPRQTRPGSRRLGQKQQKRQGPRLLLEQLEDRLAPASHTWSGVVDANFSHAGNWSAGGAPTANEANVQLLFPSITGVIANLNNDVSNLSITSLTFQASGYSITTGNSVTFASGAGVSSS